MTATDMVRRRPGRPRGFNPDEVLDLLVELFWRNGYEGTSLLDMVAATGCNKSSLRAAFGNKQEIYAAVVDRYHRIHLQPALDGLRNGSGGLEDVTTFLHHHRARMRGPRSGLGCLAANTAAELGSGETVAGAFHGRYRHALTVAFAAALTRAAAQLQIDRRSIDERALVLSTLFLGLTVSCRAGANGDELERRFESAEIVLAAWGD